MTTQDQPEQLPPYPQPSTDNPALDIDGAEVVLLIEALDAFIGKAEDRRGSVEIEERMVPYWIVRSKLKRAIRMSFYDSARGWLEAELARERTALSDELFTRLCDLLRTPGATPRSVREGYSATMLELREARQSKPRPLSTPDHFGRQ